MTPTKFILGFFGVLTLLLFLLIWFVVAAHSNAQRERYPDWVKLTGRTDITLEEFMRLDNGGHLKDSRK